jgi:hypothetical protein
MSSTNTNVAKQGRQDRLIQENVHDPYMAKLKLPEPTLCPACQAVFRGGRWQWVSTAPSDANEEHCPACRRIQDKVPAGILTLSGEFFAAHRAEIMNLVHNKEEAEKAQHPLKRLMAIEEQGSARVLTFTDMHLPRGVGEAIQRAYEGELDIQYTKEANLVRVTWTR